MSETVGSESGSELFREIRGFSHRGMEMVNFTIINQTLIFGLCVGYLTGLYFASDGSKSTTTAQTTTPQVNI